MVDVNIPIDVVIIGAGPAGLTAAYQLSKQGISSTVLEADDVVGGIARTTNRDGWMFDVGGHRFFTKVPAVEQLWFEILGEENFLLRPRQSRIFYHGVMFDYPLRAFNALRGLGLIESLRCFLSYAWVHIRPPRDQSSFEGWTASRFGWRLYRTFFKTYTEKVWGIPANEIQADWAVQRIKNLSLMKATLNALLPARRGQTITSLIDEFRYPKYGPGMMWEYAKVKAERGGSRVIFNARVTGLIGDGNKAVAVMADTDAGQRSFEATHIISSMPLGELVRCTQPPPPDSVLAAARALRHRDFLTVALVIPADRSFPDNWIYIHDTNVRVGRIQNFGAWSPYMVKDGRTCLGLEYFVTEGDPLWSMDDAGLVSLAKSELDALGLVESRWVEKGYVVRMPKAYPLYDAGYQANVLTIREWLDANLQNVYPVGRNGMHRYNNQDHSVYTAMLAVEKILGRDCDIWSVNVEAEFHEEIDLRAQALAAASTVE